MPRNPFSFFFPRLTIYIISWGACFLPRPAAAKLAHRKWQCLLPRVSPAIFLQDSGGVCSCISIEKKWQLIVRERRSCFKQENAFHDMERKEPKTVDVSLYDREYFLSHCEGYREFRDGSISRRLKRAIGFVPDDRQMKILDIGCGRGELMQYFAEKGHVCEGIDYSSDAIEIARETAQSRLSKKRLRDCRFRRMDATSLEFDSDIFDMSMMLDVVEHLHPPILEKVLQEVRRVLKPDGSLIIHTVPNKWIIKPARLAMHILGIPSETERHVNEQSLFTLRKAVQPFFSGRVWIERTKGFWSFWGESSSRMPSRFIVHSLRALDFLSDNRCVSPIIELPPLIFLFGTDIWGDLSPKK